MPSMVARLPARVPSSRRTVRPSERICSPPSRCCPGGAPAAVVWSVVSAMPRGPFKRIAICIASGCTCSPSAISPKVGRSSSSAAPGSPGCRCLKADMALKRCVTKRAPAAKPACASSALAAEWPSETSTPLARRRAMASSAPGSSGAIVVIRGGAASTAATRSGVGSSISAGSWAPAWRGLKNGPSRCAPRTRAPRDRTRAAASTKARPSASGREISVGMKAVTPVVVRATDIRSMAPAPSVAS